MKNLKKGLRYSLYLVLALVLCVGCIKKNEPSVTITTFEGQIDEINTLMFKDGDTLYVGFNGSLVTYDSLSNEKVVGVVKNDTIHILESGAYTFSGALAN